MGLKRAYGQQADTQPADGRLLLRRSGVALNRPLTATCAAPSGPSSRHVVGPLGPMARMQSCAARSSTLRGVPRTVRYAGLATSARYELETLRATRLESGNSGLPRNATSIPSPMKSAMTSANTNYSCTPGAGSGHTRVRFGAAVRNGGSGFSV